MRIHTLTGNTESRLHSVTNTTAGETVTFTYDGDGRRVLRDTITDTIAYVGPHYELRFNKTNKPEDLDGDCRVTVIDIMQVAAHWGLTDQDAGWDARYDLVGNGVIDIYDVQQVAGQWRGTCHVLAEVVKYYALGGRRIAMRRNNTLYYLLGDHLGSTSVTYRASDGQTTTQRYYPWGTIRPGPANTLPTDRTFTGQQLDETIGLLYYSDGAGYGRYYDPLLGRFTQPDTFVPSPGDPQQLNRFTYARNNPLRYRDSSGHWLETAWDIANILWDIREVRQDRSLVNIGALVVDVGAALLPFVPAGVGLVVHGGEAGKAAVEVATHWDEAVDAVRVAGRLDEAADAVSAARRLREVGLHADEAERLVKILAEASTRGNLTKGGVVSIGHFRSVREAPGYIEWAEQAKAVYFNMDEAAWKSLGREEVWAINKQFLDNAVEAGARFHLQIPDALDPGSFFAREIRYLVEEKGYRKVLGNEGWWLVHP